MTLLSDLAFRLLTLLTCEDRVIENAVLVGAALESLVLLGQISAVRE